MNVKWTSDENGLYIEIPENIDNKLAIVLKIQAESLQNYNKEAVLKLADRGKELTQWWKNQQLIETKSSYQKVTRDNKKTWVIKSDNSLAALVDGNEISMGIKALDVGASSSGTVYIGLNGSVYLHANHKLKWLEWPKEVKSITQTSIDGKEWIKLSGIKAKRCDIGQTGTIWVIGEDNKVAYFNGIVWKPLDKEAEDIACGGGWVGSTAIISNGQLERFEGTFWKNLGGENLKNLDISIKDEVIVTLSGSGTISLYDIIGSVEVDTGNNKYKDISCGLINNKETVVLIKE